MDQNTLFKDTVGTHVYMAPEIHLKLPYLGWAVDIWSLGIILFTMLTGQLPFQSKIKEEVS